MKDLSILGVQQVRIFTADVIPLTAFTTAAGINALKETFGFSSLGPGDDGTDLVVLRGGVCPLDESGNFAVINALHLNDRRVIVDVRADSSTTSAVFGAIWAALSSVKEDRATSVAPPPPIVFTEECKSVSTLDFDWAAVFPPALAGYAAGDRLVDLLSSPQARADISGFSIGFRIRYDLTEKSISRAGITIGDKVVKLEPRVGTTREQRRYFAESPTSSDDHINLLREIEAALTGGSPK